MWKYKLITTEDTQVCNAPCRVKKIALYHTASTTAIIYNEVVSSGSPTAAKKVWTLATKHETHLEAPDTIVDIEILHDEIDFGDEGLDFYEGCYIDWVAAGTVLVVYKL